MQNSDKSSQDDQDTQVVDFIKRNLSQSNQKKNAEFERNKQYLRQVADSILMKRGLLNEKVNICKIQQHLRPKVLMANQENQNLMEVIDQANELNKAFLKIKSQISCYKIELAITLERMVESYNSLLLSQIEVIQRLELEREKNFQHKIKLQQIEKDKFQEKQQNFNERFITLEKLINSKQVEIDSLKLCEDFLQQENEYLKSKVQDQKLEINDFKMLQDQNQSLVEPKKRQQNIQRSQLVTPKTRSSTSRMLIPNKLKQQKKVDINYNSVEVQVEENDLQELEQVQLITQPVQLPPQSPSKSNKSRKYDVDVDQKELQDLHLDHNQKDDEIVSDQSHSLDVQDNYQQSINQLMNILKSNNIQQQEGKLLDKSLKFTVPNQILNFITPSLSDQAQKIQLLSWPQLKEIIYKIYDHRIINSQEIGGAIQNNYLGFEEFLLIYHLELYQDRKMTEQKIIQLLASLYYYQFVWHRAKTFSLLINILQAYQDSNDSNFPLISRKSISVREDYSYELNDIYTQEFYLHCYSQVIRQRNSLLETKEGQTLIKSSQQEAITGALFPFFTNQDQNRWNHKMRRNIKKIRVDANDDIETDYLDVDLLQYWYLEEYKVKKQQNQNTIAKLFIKYNSEVQGELKSEEIYNLLHSYFPSTSSSAFVKYPSNIICNRALLDTFLNIQSYKISTNEFVKSCKKFGLDNPFPIVTKKLSLYGNDTDVEEYIKQELQRYNIKLQNQMHTSKNYAVSIKTTSQVTNSVAIENEDQENLIDKVKRIKNLKLLPIPSQSNSQERERQTKQLVGGVKINIDDIKPHKEEIKQLTQKGQYIVTSYQSTSQVLVKHLDIIVKLKESIEKLKNAHNNQRDDERSWEQIDQILQILEKAQEYLDIKSNIQ